MEHKEGKEDLVEVVNGGRHGSAAAWLAMFFLGNRAGFTFCHCDRRGN